MSPLITISNLKYLACHFNLFDINSYAMFEAKRPDVDTNFFKGLAGYENDISDSNPYFVGLVGKRQGMAKFSDKPKQEKHRSKYLAIKQKYLATNIKP